jgi:hypothetical protein
MAKHFFAVSGSRQKKFCRQPQKTHGKKSSFFAVSRAICCQSFLWPSEKGILS